MSPAPRTTESVSVVRKVVFDEPASPTMTLSPLRRGPGDPCYRVLDGAIWKTSLMPSGAVTARIVKSGSTTVDCEAWGSGATEFVEQLPALLGADDDRAGFAPTEPTIAAAHRRVPHLRLGRTGRVLEALIPAILEQRVAGKDAFRAWRLLVTKYGTPAPGPAPIHMRVPPSAEAWRAIPSWEFHLANVDPGRARTVVGCAQRADALERLTKRPPDEARTAMMSLPGVGVWDRRRDRTARMGRRRRRLGGRLPPFQHGGQQSVGLPNRRCRDAGVARTAASAPPARGATARGQWARTQSRFGARQAIPDLRAI